MYKKILVAVTDEERSFDALHQAILFAGKNSAEIISLFVILENSIDHSHILADKMKLGFPQIPFLTCTSKNIASAIAETAEKENCDLIVMGSRRLPGPTSLVMRSVTNAVISASQKPVLVI